MTSLKLAVLFPGLFPFGTIVVDPVDWNLEDRTLLDAKKKPGSSLRVVEGQHPSTVPVLRFDVFTWWGTPEQSRQEADQLVQSANQPW